MSHKRSAAEMLSPAEHVVDLTVDEALFAEDDEEEDQHESTQKMSQESSGAPQKAGPEPTQKMEDNDGVPDSQPTADKEAPHKDGPQSEKEDAGASATFCCGKEKDGHEELAPLAMAAAFCLGEPASKRRAAQQDKYEDEDYGRSKSRSGLMIAVAGLSDKTKAALLNAWIGRDLLPLRDSPLCTLRIHHCNIDHIVIAEPPMHDSRYRSSITFAELYQASRKFLPHFHTSSYS